MTCERFAVVRVPLPFTDRDAAKNLPAPSKVRFKLFTLDHRLVRGQVGTLSDRDAKAVRSALDRLLGQSVQS